MGITINNIDIDMFGSHQAVVVDATIDNYTAGGEPLSLSEVGLNRQIFTEAKMEGAVGIMARYDSVNEQVMLFQQANDGTGTATDNFPEVPDAETVNEDVTVLIVGK